MRKLIFFVVLLCTIGYSQVIQYRDTSYTGNQQFKTVMPTQPLPVKDSLLITATESSTNSYSQFITATSAKVDTVNFGFDTRTVTFINDGATTDTLYVSTSNTFPVTNTIVRFGGEGFTKKMKVSTLYYKVGNVPLANKKIRIEGY